MVLHMSGREVLHASALRLPAGVVALCADSGTGKSTIAFALNSRGYPLWADDLVAFEVSDHGMQAISLPFSLRLRPSAAALFDLNAAQLPVEASGDGVTPGTEKAPLAAICVLRREVNSAAPVTVRRLALADSFAAVLAHAWSFALQDRQRKRRMINHYLELVSKIPIFEISFRPGFEDLPALLESIEQLAGEPSNDLMRIPLATQSEPLGMSR
jgi:zona occludens toxin (predicted ATPase)